MDAYIYEATGTLLEIIYHNEDNGYTVCVISDENENEIMAVGYMPYVAVGETVKVVGKWSTHPDYGEQLKIEYYEKIAPKTVENIRQYLASGIIRGIGPSTAKKIVDSFGEQALIIMENEPHRLAEISGISIKKANEIAVSYLEKQAAQNVVIFLQKYGVTPNLAMRTYAKLGKSAIDKIKSNPYILCDEIEGVGFKTADEIAINMGIDGGSIFRIKSGIRYLLAYHANNSGHTCIPRSNLVYLSCQLLGIQEIEAENGIVSLLADSVLFSERIQDFEMIYLAVYANAEQAVATKLILLALSEFKISQNEIKKQISQIEAESDITLDEKQKLAVESAAEHGILVITGGPGTGKTTTINSIIKLFAKQGLKVLLAAPTGRAAKRMSNLTGLEAKTIHRLLEVEFKDNSRVQTFARNETNPLDADVIIIDETSMLDILLMNSLLKAIPANTRLILVGDVDQLPSVGAGVVLKDIIASETIPVIRLNTVFRQASESMIVVNAHKINNGDYPVCNQKGSDFFLVRCSSASEITNTICELVYKRLPQTYNKNPFTDIQVISPMKKTPTGVWNLNEVLQHKLNQPSKNKAEKKIGNRIFRVGDKVMQIKNNYDIEYEKTDGAEVGCGIFNGDIGIIERIDTSGQFLSIIFDDDKRVEYPFSSIEELSLSYAMTVHKSQGNEFPVVVIPVVNGPKMLMTRNLFYTAVTRAKELVVLVGNEYAIKSMVDNNTETKRYSGLITRLKQTKDTPAPQW